MKLYLVDGTYELFRNHFGAPPRKAPDGREVGAALSLLRGMYALLSMPGITHVGCAFDHVIESFRNDLYPGYKTSQGVDEHLLAQFSLAEEVVSALGVVVWPMIEFEADDALAAATARFKDQAGVEQVVLCSPDKDLAQMVSGSKIVSWDRRKDIVMDEEGVVAKFGVRPNSIPDWLALVGDSADGYPGIPGWGAKSTALVLSRFEHLELIPEYPQSWGLGAARAARLAESLEQRLEDAQLFKQLATLRVDVPITETLDDLEWHGAHERLKKICEQLGDTQFPKRVTRWRED